MLIAALDPIFQDVPLRFEFGNQTKMVLTNADGTASAVFRCRTGEASVSGTVNAQFVSDAIMVMCHGA